MGGEFDPDLLQDFDDRTLQRFLLEDRYHLGEEEVTLIVEELTNRGLLQRASKQQYLSAASDASADCSCGQTIDSQWLI